MKKIYLKKNPEVFQGKEILKTNKNYFEGWYFKNSTSDKGISFIPGINITKEERKAFVQVITNNSSYFISYPIEDFTFNIDPFSIKIKNNYFSKEKLHIDITDKEKNLNIYGTIKYINNENIKTSFISPNIMGPFSYLPFMECNHAILSMKHSIFGSLMINDEEMIFNNAIGYIEKDWGSSFPKNYIWLQGNNFSEKSASFMCAIANISLKLFDFQGFICVLIVEGKEYKFTTYNCSKIINYEKEENTLHITLKKGNYILDIKSIYKQGEKLIAPNKGNMEKSILESIDETINITLKRNQEVIFNDTSINCGLEIVE